MPGLKFCGVLWVAGIIPSLMLTGAAWFTGSLLLNTISVLVSCFVVVVLVAALAALNTDKFTN